MEQLTLTFDELAQKYDDESMPFEDWFCMRMGDASTIKERLAEKYSACKFDVYPKNDAVEYVGVLTSDFFLSLVRSSVSDKVRTMAQVRSDMLNDIWLLHCNIAATARGLQGRTEFHLNNKAAIQAIQRRMGDLQCMMYEVYEMVLPLK